MRHNDRCPQCKRYVPRDPGAGTPIHPYSWYDRLDREDDMSEIVVFCGERHADQFHRDRKQQGGA